MSSTSHHRHKSRKRSPYREDTYKRKKYDRDDYEEDIKVKKERPFDDLEHNRDSHNYKRETEQYFEESHKREKSYRSERHSSSQRKPFFKQELPNLPAGKWEKEEKFNAHIKTEPVTDDELNVKHKSMTHTKVEDVKNEDRESWGKQDIPKVDPEKKETINLGLSGKLTEDTNTYNGVVINYSQPPEARKPKRRWRWYIFKEDQDIPFLPLHRQSAYLIGRNRKVADIPIDHPSCSKQHAVLQYRLVSYTRADGSSGRTVKPYLIDLESANGTYVNTKRIAAKKYVELLEKDVVKFGFSSREYVLLHEGSKDSDNDIINSSPELSPFSVLKS